MIQLSVCSGQDAATLIEKAGIEERRVYMSSTPKTPSEDKGKGIKEEAQNPPPPPIILSRIDHSMSFAPAPYNLEGQVRFTFNYAIIYILTVTKQSTHVQIFLLWFYLRYAGTSFAVE